MATTKRKKSAKPRGPKTKISRSYPHVIWVDMEPSGKLNAWYGNPDDGSRPFGIPTTAKRYEFRQ